MTGDATVRPLDDVQYWSLISTLTTDGNYIKNLASPSRREGKREKEKQQREIGYDLSDYMLGLSHN